MIKKNQIPTILGVILLLAGTIAGVVFLNMRQVFRIGADASVTPKDIRTSNISGTSSTISWTTDKETSGFVVWGENQGSVSKIEQESQNEDKFFTHSISLSGLKPGTTYFYKINSAGTTFDNNGIPWEFTTGPELNIDPDSFVISGSVITASGSPSKRALVYMTVGGYLASTLTSEIGNFVFQLGQVRTQDLQNYAQIDPAQTLLEISVQAGPDGIASAQIFPQSANPIPTMILGQVYDLRNNEPNKDGQNPGANLKLPENTEGESKFNVSQTSSPSPTSVILESLSEGEIVTSTKPAFFGRGPGGEEITITVESENPITQEVTIAKDGTWTWNPPTDLAPGAHKITVSWIDTAGITRTLTRNFIVQAGEAPAFEATPSQTLSPSASPTASIAPTGSPSGTPSAAPVPVTGSLTPSILFSILGLGVLALSFSIWKYAQSI